MKYRRFGMRLGIIFKLPASFFINPNADGPGKPHLFYHCPLGKGMCGVPLKPGKPNRLGAIWDWDGSMDAPTLSPSINCMVENGGCGWHGYIRDGVWLP